MRDISNEISEIQEAARGSEIRQPIVDALNALNGGTLPQVSVQDAKKILVVNSQGQWVASNEQYVPTPTGVLNISENGTYNVADKAQAVVSVSGGGSSLGTKTITQNGTYNASSDDLDGYSQVTVNVSGGGLSGTTFPPSSIGNDGDEYIYNFPSGLTPVEYLESTGAQYIATGLLPDYLYDFYLKGIVSDNSDEHDFFGARGSSGTDNAFMWFYSASKANIRKLKNTSSGMNIAETLSSPQYPLSVESFSQSIISSNTTVFLSLAVSKCYGGSLASFTSSYDIMLFGVNKNGTYSPTPSILKRVTFYKSGEMMGDYVPCLDSNNVPCMYDLVSGQCKYNAGSGSFTYGSQATFEPVRFIKKSGIWMPVRKELM